MNDLNICVITQTLPKAKGGHILLSRLLKLLEPICDEIFTITSNFPDDSMLNMKIHIKNVKSDDKIETMWIRTYKYILTQLRISIAFAKIYKNIDVVIFYVGGTALLLPMIFTKMLGKKAVLIATGSGFESAKMIYGRRFFGLGGVIFSNIIKIFEIINYTLSDKIIVYSKISINQLRLENHIGKIAISPEHFLDYKIFTNDNNINQRNNLIGYIGRLSEEKGALNFTRAIPIILKTKSEVDFKIIGDGDLRNKIGKYLDDNNLNDIVKITGWIPHNKIPYCLNELKLVVLPSYTEGLPNLMLEAMACGTPVLATAVGTIPSIIRDGETGFIMENNSPECIAENAIRALDHPVLEMIVENARAVVEREFTYETAVDRYRKILGDFKGI